MKEFNNKNVMVCSIHTIIPTPQGNVVGDHIYVDSTPNKDRKFNVPEGGIWMKNLDDPFQNKENFIRGIKYISEFANPTPKKMCLELLDTMTDHYDSKNSDLYCKCLGFFCEVGVWKNPKLRQKSEYHKDFPKYLSNCMNLYFKSIHEMCS